MKRRPQRRAGVAVLAAAAAAAAVLGAAGCSTLGYYAQSLGGHLDVLHRARPIEQWLAEPGTPESLRAKLELAQRLRRFAVAELHLPDNASFQRYADLERSAAVWNVVAAPELSLTLQTWCYPIMGCVGYRGYYKRDEADAKAAELKAQGLETYVYGVPAYSTLGWSNWLGGDPLLNTFITWSEAELARLVFHELAHQVEYASDDTTFNESFAVAVERIGSARWLERNASGELRAQTAQDDARRQDFRAFAARWRGELEAIYADSASDDDKRARKAEAMARMRAEAEAMKRERWNGYAGYDRWFAGANNAVFGVQAAYDELVPQFERLFEAAGGDFERFYAQVKDLGKLPHDRRRARLNELAAAASAATSGSR